MTVALGASAYSIAIFHLVTHAFFKALLFLAAGSVIVALHHEQDMRRMGGLWKRMPITYLTALTGSLALAGIPPFAGFFSKDAIIEAVALSNAPGSGIAYVAVVSGVFLTAFYSFRLIFMVFHGPSRMSDENRKQVRESPSVVTAPLVLLAIPSVIAGWLLVRPVFSGHLFGSSLIEGSAHEGEVHGAYSMLIHAPVALPLWLAIAGILMAWLFYVRRPDLPDRVSGRLQIAHRVLLEKYGIDELYHWLFVTGGQGLGRFFWRIGDRRLIDDSLVNGAARAVGYLSEVARRMQTGYVYHYAFAMIVGVVVLLSWFLWI
jgi:NADH-quinone oxidoreductase subunit L